MPTPLTVAEAHELIRLCEAGRLFAVDAWIRAGRSVTVPIEVRRTPLGVAVYTGFHSLVELLLRHAESQEAKDEALRDALLGNRRPFIELAITYGADVRAVPFIDVLMTGDRGVVSLFLERGPTRSRATRLHTPSMNSAPRPLWARTLIADATVRT